MIKVHTGLHVKYLFFLSEFIEIHWDFRNMLKLSNVTKIRPFGAEMFHADGRIDGQKERQAWHS